MSLTLQNRHFSENQESSIADALHEYPGFPESISQQTEIPDTPQLFAGFSETFSQIEKHEELKSLHNFISDEIYFTKASIRHIDMQISDRKYMNQKILSQIYSQIEFADSSLTGLKLFSGELVSMAQTTKTHIFDKKNRLIEFKAGEQIACQKDIAKLESEKLVLLQQYRMIKRKFEVVFR